LIEATASGVVEGYLVKGKDYVSVRLEDVWLVPGIGRNLLSVKQLAVVTNDIVSLGPYFIQRKFNPNEPRVNIKLFSRKLYEVSILPVVEEVPKC
jgi:hypothetical protein